MYTNQQILEIAMKQSAIDLNCNEKDFMTGENKIVISAGNEKARRYLVLPFECDLVSYGNNIVASVKEEYIEIVDAYINKYPVEHCFETPNMHILNDAFQKYGMRVCFMAEYFLPDMSKVKEVSCQYELRVLEKKDFTELYNNNWSNALCEKNKHLNVLGVGAYQENNLVGLAACSADCDTMWQIGIDVLEDYRKKGIATALTSKLALEIMKKGKVPFYCTAWSNIKSVKNAIKSGFRPAWVEMTIKPRKLIDDMNK
jgi:ribosomal protein S18 acetylase RimI-like enzyme